MGVLGEGESDEGEYDRKASRRGKGEDACEDAVVGEGGDVGEEVQGREEKEMGAVCSRDSQPA